MGQNFNDVKANKIIIVILISSIHTTIMIIVNSNFTINCLSLSLPRFSSAIAVGSLKFVWDYVIMQFC